MTGRDKLLAEALVVAKQVNYEGIFLMPTGTGKGKLMIEIMKILKPKRILYLCDSVLLRDKMFKDELIKWDCKQYIPLIDFVCYQTACKFVGKEYDLVLADEFDAALTPTRTKIFKNNKFKNKILVSATLDDTKRIKAKKIAPIVFERTPKQVIEDKIVNGVNFYFVNYNLSPDENSFYLNYNIQFKKLLNQFQSPEVALKLDMLKIQRKQFLGGLKSSRDVTKWLMANLNKRNEKILVFCGLTSQAESICKYTYHSGNEKLNYLEAFDKGEIMNLVVVDKVNRGLNIDSIRNIIFESVGSSKTKLTQRMGRGSRLDVNEKLNVFFPIPYFMSMWGERKPTILLKWVTDATTDMDLKDAKTIIYKP